MTQPGPNSPTPSQGAFSFHPLFNRKVVPAVFSVDGVGFKVDVALLTGHSEVLRGMFSDATELGLPGEGTEEHPIVIEWCTAAAFANFLEWLTHAPWSTVSAATELKRVLDILHISHCFEIQAGVDYATKELERLDIHPAQRLSLAQRYGLHKWIADAVRSLLSTPFSSINNDNRAFLLADQIFILSSTKEKITEQRHRLALFPPRPDPDSAPYCAQPDVCRKVFEERWLYVVNRRLLSTLAPIPIAELPTLIKDTFIPGMVDECKQYIVDWLGDSDHIRVEENLIADAVKEMTKLCI